MIGTPVPLPVDDGLPRSSNRDIVYACGVCGEVVGRDNLVVKRATFLTMGKNAKNIRSRVVAWVCRTCLAKDPDYNREHLAASPGMRDTSLAS